MITFTSVAHMIMVYGLWFTLSKVKRHAQALYMFIEPMASSTLLVPPYYRTSYNKFKVLFSDRFCPIKKSKVRSS